MTTEQFQEAILSLGIALTPDPSHDGECQWRGRDDPNSNERGSVTRNEGLILSSLAKGKRVVEIGTGVGVSTVCLAHEAVEVATVDPDDWVNAAVQLPLNVTRFKHSDQLSEKYPAAHFDLAFIDGLHDCKSVTSDILACLYSVRPGGLIAFHDGHWDEVKEAFNSFEWVSTVVHNTVGSLTVCEMRA